MANTTIKITQLPNIGNNLGASTLLPVVDTSGVSNFDISKYVLNDVKRAIIEEVFGEFRAHFRAMEMALWEHDIDKARAALKAFETQMFTVDKE